LLGPTAFPNTQQKIKKKKSDSHKRNNRTKTEKKRNRITPKMEEKQEENVQK
jgi:hypothetical protein